jgi:hypothetical protein
MGHWINRAAAVTLAALSVACGASDTVEPSSDPATAPIVVRLSCDDALGRACDGAIAVWSPALGGTRWRFVRAGEASIVVPVRVVHGNAEACEGFPSWLACTRRDGIDLDVDAYRGWADPEGAMVGTLVHEVGHVLGLPHLSSGVMSAGQWRLQCIDDVTAATIPGAVATCP